MKKVSIDSLEFGQLFKLKPSSHVIYQKRGLVSDTLFYCDRLYSKDYFRLIFKGRFVYVIDYSI